jgi:hypothetical protein
MGGQEVFAARILTTRVDFGTQRRHEHAATVGQSLDATGRADRVAYAVSTLGFGFRAFGIVRNGSSAVAVVVDHQPLT